MKLVDQRLKREKERLRNSQVHVGEPGRATLDGINALYQFIDTCIFSELRLKARKLVLKICKYEWELNGMLAAVDL